MRLKQFINENRGKVLSLDDTKKLLQTKCSKAVEAYKKGNVIYRGIKNINDAYILSTPSEFTRKSKNTDNYYTLINDNSPAWAKYPKRSKSIICVTDSDIAHNYGTLYTVFPFDNAKIGVCSDADYWVSFPFLTKTTGILTMAEFNAQLWTIFYIEIDDRSIGDINKVKTYKDLQKLFHEFDKFVKDFNNTHNNEKDKQSVIDIIKDKNSSVTLLDEYEKFMNMEEYFRYLLDPNKNKFKLKKIGDRLPKDKEVWTDSNSILIRTGIENEILL